MAKDSLDQIFENLTLRVTSDAPAHNYMVRVEDLEGIKQEVKEYFTLLGERVIKDQKSKAAWRRKVAEL